MQAATRQFYCLLRHKFWHGIQHSALLLHIIWSMCAVSHSGQGILSWQRWLSGKMTDWCVRFWIQDHVVYSSSCVGCETVKKGLGRSDDAPLTLSCRVIPHPYTSRCTWQLGPAGTCAPLACRKSAPRLAHWSLATSSVYTLTHMDGLSEYLLHQNIQHGQHQLVWNKIVTKERIFWGFKVKVSGWWNWAFCLALLEGSIHFYSCTLSVLFHYNLPVHGRATWP